MLGMDKGEELAKNFFLESSFKMAEYIQTVKQYSSPQIKWQSKYGGIILLSYKLSNCTRRTKKTMNTIFKETRRHMQSQTTVCNEEQ